MSDKTLIVFEDAEARYKDSIALRQINLSIVQGEKIALIGRSGSGKSTLLRLIYDKLPSNTALVPQDEGLVSSLSVFHNVFMGRLSSHPSWYNLVNLIRPFKARVAEVDAVLQRVSLSEKCFDSVAELSGGQRQRVALARSLYQGGDILLADEPVSAVDETQASQIISELSEMFQTMVVVLHDTQLALTYCDRVIGLKGGRIVLDQPSKQLFESDLADLYHEEHSS